MSQELSKELRCIVVRNGANIWLEEEKIDNLQKILANLKDHKFIIIGRETINTADLVGIFEPATMDEIIRRKNGQWKGEDGKWHNKGEVLCPRGCGQVIPYGMTCGNHGSR